MVTRYITDASSYGIEYKDAELRNVHQPSQCSGEYCTIHNPSDHHMRGWPTVWNADYVQLDRRCEHGILHPDPDDLAHRKRTRRDLGLGGHNIICDGCCVPPS